MSNVSVGRQLTEEKHQLKQNASKIVWLLEVTYDSSKNKTTRYFSAAMAVKLKGRKEGFLLTYADNDVGKARLRARRYDSEEETFYPASIIFHFLDWGLVLLCIEGIRIGPVGKLAEDGKLSCLQELHCLGSYRGYHEIFKSGKVCYPCINDVDIPERPIQRCKRYECDVLYQTPHYRMLGHVYNNHDIKLFECGDPRVDNCEARIPVIQLKDSGGAIGYQSRQHGFEGAPVFNGKGDILGLVGWNCGSFQIAIHVSLLKAFLEKAREYLEKKKPPPVQASGSNSKSQSHSKDKGTAIRKG